MGKAPPRTSVARLTVALLSSVARLLFSFSSEQKKLGKNPVIDEASRDPRRRRRCLDADWSASLLHSDSSTRGGRPHQTPRGALH